MTYITKELEKRNKELALALEKIDANEKNEPKGRLRVSNSNGIPQYYLITDSKDTRGRYIRKDEQDIVPPLAQKWYYKKIKSIIQKEQDALDRYLEIARNKSPEIFNDSITKERKSNIDIMLMSDKEYETWWMNKKEEYSEFHSEELVYETDRGEMVRTKAEMMIANAYYEYGIPYKYECKLYLRDGMYKYPDFKVLDVKKRKEYVHEHLGLIDMDEYRHNNLKKLEIYSENGINTGTNLILTFESEGCPYNIKSIKNMIRNIFDC